MPVVEHQIRVLARPDGAHARVHAQDAGGRDRDGAQRPLLIQPAAHQIPRDDRQQPLRHHRRVRAERKLDARCGKGHGRVVIDVHLDLPPLGEERADDHRHALARQRAGDAAAAGAVLQRQVKAELPRQADGGEHVVRAVRMALERHLAAQHLGHVLKRQVAFGRFALARLGARAGLHIRLRVIEALAQQAHAAHARIRLLARHLAVAALRVLAKGRLERRFLLHDHIVHAVPHGLDDRERAADEVGAARTGADGGDARLIGIGHDAAG